MARVKFYRGDQISSLPDVLEDGAIYLLESGDNAGELYADVNNQRIRIGIGQSFIIVKTTAEWNAENPKRISKSGVMYVYSDARSYEEEYTENNETLTRTVYVPGVKIGDGSAYVVDLPFVNVTSEQISFWNNKVNCYLEPELIPNGNSETLIFTRTQ